MELDRLGFLMACFWRAFQRPFGRAAAVVRNDPRHLDGIHIGTAWRLVELRGRLALSLPFSLAGSGLPGSYQRFYPTGKR
jgi:hypothetical protein